jgi:hypothetical protein
MMGNNTARAWIRTTAARCDRGNGRDPLARASPIATIEVIQRKSKNGIPTINIAIAQRLSVFELANMSLTIGVP